jgi:hypothetical protein
MRSPHTGRPETGRPLWPVFYAIPGESSTPVAALILRLPLGIFHAVFDGSAVPMTCSQLWSRP